MPTSIYEITARCPREVAFDYVADVTRHPEWATDRMSVELLQPGAPRLGSRYRTTGHSEVWHVDVVAEVEVTRFERPDAFEIVCRDAHGEFRHLFTFSAEPEGTRIERHYTTPAVISEEARRRVAELMPTVIEPSRRGAMARLRDRLEALVTASSA